MSGEAAINDPKQGLPRDVIEATLAVAKERNTIIITFPVNPGAKYLLKTCDPKPMAVSYNSATSGPAYGRIPVHTIHSKIARNMVYDTQHKIDDDLKLEQLNCTQLQLTEGEIRHNPTMNVTHKETIAGRTKYTLMTYPDNNEAPYISYAVAESNSVPTQYKIFRQDMSPFNVFSNAAKVNYCADLDVLLYATTQSQYDAPEHKTKQGIKPDYVDRLDNNANHNLLRNPEHGEDEEQGNISDFTVTINKALNTAYKKLHYLYDLIRHNISSDNPEATPLKEAHFPMNCFDPKLGFFLIHSKAELEFYIKSARAREQDDKYVFVINHRWKLRTASTLPTTPLTPTCTQITFPAEAAGIDINHKSAPLSPDAPKPPPVPNMMSPAMIARQRRASISSQNSSPSGSPVKSTKSVETLTPILFPPIQYWQNDFSENFKQGVTHFMNGNYGEAVTFFNLIINPPRSVFNCFSCLPIFNRRVHPVSLERKYALHYLANCYTYSKKFNTALKLIDKLITDNSDNIELQFNRAEIYLAQNEYDDATDAYKNLLKKVEKMSRPLQLQHQFIQNHCENRITQIENQQLLQPEPPPNFTLTGSAKYSF